MIHDTGVWALYQIGGSGVELEWAVYLSVLIVMIVNANAVINDRIALFK